MKRALLLLSFAAAALLTTVGGNVNAQEDNSGPEIQAIQAGPIPEISHHSSHAASAKAGAVGAVATAPGIPMWNYTVGNYSYTMVGGNPFFNGARTTNIPTVIVPIVVSLADGSKFDPTAADPCAGGNNALNLVSGSPLFQPYNFTINGINMGSGQYIDEFQRANFYNSPGTVSETGLSYHNVLIDANGNPGAAVLQPVPFNIPQGLGQSFNRFTCAPIAVVDFNTFNTMLANNVFPTLSAQGYGPSTFIVFLLHNVVMGQPGDSLFSNCCVVGYHAPTQATTNTSAQTYVVADYDTTGVLDNKTSNLSVLSNEIAEWMTNPLSGNLTPTWGKIGNVSTCVNYLSVSVPSWGWTFSVSGLKMPNGSTYFVPQLTYLSWFLGQFPSMGAGGIYSDGNALPAATNGCI